MKSYTSCGWCHRMNSLDATHCQECGHEVGVARMNCQCPKCSTPYVPETFDREAIDAAIEELKHRSRTINLNPNEE